jgi:hypothetical protein
MSLCSIDAAVSPGPEVDLAAGTTRCRTFPCPNTPTPALAVRMFAAWSASAVDRHIRPGTDSRSTAHRRGQEGRRDSRQHRNLAPPDERGYRRAFARCLGEPKRNL